MVTGKILSTSVVEEKILSGEFATNFSSAIRKFGTRFIAVHPVPEGCQRYIAELADPNERVEPDTCYVLRPDNF